MHAIVFAYLKKYGPIKRESKIEKIIEEEVARQRDLQKEKEGNELWEALIIWCATNMSVDNMKMEQVISLS